MLVLWDTEPICITIFHVYLDNKISSFTSSKILIIVYHLLTTLCQFISWLDENVSYIFEFHFRSLSN